MRVAARAVGKESAATLIKRSANRAHGDEHQLSGKRNNGQRCRDGGADERQKRELAR